MYSLQGIGQRVELSYLCVVCYIQLLFTLDYSFSHFWINWGFIQYLIKKLKCAFVDIMS